MSSGDRGPAGWIRLGCSAAAVMLAATACGSSTTTPGSTLQQPPTAKMAPLASIGAGEGQLNLVLWDGYADKSWVDPFTATTGCKVTQHPAGSSDEMVSLMKDGGGGNWDMVSASGDADLRLIYSGDVRPMNTALIPDFTNFQTFFQSPPYNTIGGVHYGISLQWGPNTLLYNTKKFVNPPTSWNAIYDTANKGLVTVPDNPIQIADAALYLSKTTPSLGIKDPYELTQKQFDAAVTLLKNQHPLIKKYWALATDEISLFQNGDVTIGAAWPYQTIQLKLAGAPVADTIPSEGATGWADTWMLATKATHPNCAYLWTKWVSTAKVQAMQALSFGETPVNTKACAEMEALQAGSCSQYHADAPGSYFDTIKFWKTPIAQCPDGSSSCIPYDQWVSAWTTIKG
ncbi:MAG TPA: ABC transporter substrate-binding protein [Candidatus Dormibacteraeota bacterium]|jgi:putative spermidine/putrescine transport system substrate-binding protein|nr:ABC transporter substrate-binding protein [Candidatus Dormibacteraeota bacterium]